MRGVTWLTAALLLWCAAELTRLKTDVVISHDGDNLRFEVAGTSVDYQAEAPPVRRLEVWASDGLVRLGGRRLTATSKGRTVLDQELPRRFDCRAPGSLPPVGDWWIDLKLRRMKVLTKDLELEAPYTIRLELTGRCVAPLTLIVDDGQRTRFRLQRGLLANDLSLIRQAPGEHRWAQIAPRPGQHALAAASLLLRSLAGACLLIAAAALASAFVSRFFSRAPRPPTRRSARTAAAALAVVIAVAAAALAAWVSTDVLERLPHTPDGTAYLLQAKWLLDGHLTREVPPTEIAPHVRMPFSFFVGDRWIFQYPVVWPLILAAGQIAGHPHLVTSLLGGVLVLLVYLVGTEVGDRGTALLAALLALLSPLSTLLSASFLSHAAAAAGVAAFLWLMLRAVRLDRPWLAGAAGVAIGLAFGMRPLTAMAVAATIGVWLVIEARRFGGGTEHKILLAVCIGGVVGCVPTLIGNALVTGSPVVFPYEIVTGGVYGGANIAAGIRNLDMFLATTVPMLHGWIWPLRWSELALALPLGVVLVTFLLRRSTRHDCLLAAVYLAVVAAHLGTAWNGLHGFGPRYHFEAWICLYLLSARGLRELARSGDSDNTPGWSTSTVFTAITTAALLVGSALALPARYELYRGYNFVDGALQRAIESSDPEPPALLVTDERRWFDWGRTATLIDGDPHGDFVVVSGVENIEALRRAFPGRGIWRLGTPVLEEVAPPPAGADDDAAAR